MSEILKGLWGKLYAWALPSALAVGATWLFLLPQLGDCIDLPKDNEGLVFLALTGTLAISLSSLSPHLYWLLEGYHWPGWLVEWGQKRQRAQKKALGAAVRAAASGWRFNIAREKLAKYPMDDAEILPTRFGNAIRAFETYGQTRFNMDSQTLWHELHAVTPKYIESEIDSARSSVDFFVALLYLSSFFCFACFVLGSIEHFKIGILVLCVPAFLLAVLCHWLAIRATDAWSYPIHALVNLGRVKLADSLGLKLPETLEEEKAMWGLVTMYVNDPSREYGEKLDAYRKAPTERQGDTLAEEEAGNGGAGTDDNMSMP
jgi:hypothetical protein